MTVPVAYYVFRGMAFDSGDITFGEAENKDIFINRAGTINKVNIKKDSVTFKIRGGTDVNLAAFEQEREDTVIGLINGTATPEDIDILGRTVSSAVLTKVTPSAPLSVAGNTIYESIDLEFQSQVWS